MIFAKAFLRRTNRADDFRAQIFFTADPVVDFLRERIVKKSVDSENPAQRIGLGVGENDFFRATAILVIRLGAERGDLKLLFVFNDDHHAEFASDSDGAFEKFLDLLRLGVRGDVEILGFATKQQIAHAAADPERGEASRLQTTNNFQGGIQAATKSASSGLPFLKRLTPSTLKPLTRPLASTRSITASCLVCSM